MPRGSDRGIDKVRWSWNNLGGGNESGDMVHGQERSLWFVSFLEQRYWSLSEERVLVQYTVQCLAAFRFLHQDMKRRLGMTI